MKGLGVVAVFHEFFGYHPGLFSGAAEYQAKDIRGVIDDALQGEVPVFFLDDIAGV